KTSLADVTAPTDFVRLTKSESITSAITVAGIDFNGDNITISGTGSLNIANGTGSVGLAMAGANAATATIAVPVIFSAPSGQDNMVQIEAGDTLDLTGTVTTTSGATLRKRGLGTLILTNNNSALASAVSVDEGVVGIQNNGALGTGVTTVQNGASLD